MLITPKSDSAHVPSSCTSEKISEALIEKSQSYYGNSFLKITLKNPDRVIEIDFNEMRTAMSIL